MHLSWFELWNQSLGEGVAFGGRRWGGLDILCITIGVFITGKDGCFPAPSAWKIGPDCRSKVAPFGDISIRMNIR